MANVGATLAASPELVALSTIVPRNPESAEILRVYKHGSSTYTDVTQSMAGGYRQLVVTKVRNQPGSLTFALEATTIKMLHDWIDPVARVELWVSGVRSGVYTVDEYSPKWSDLTCSVTCVGLLAAAKSATYTGTFATGYTGPAILRALASAAGLTCGSLAGTGALLGEMIFTNTSVFDAITDVCRVLGVDFWMDGDGYLTTATTASTVSKTYVLGDDAHEFETSYNAKDIINQLFLTCDGRGWTFNDAASQALYGVRTQRVSVAGLVSSTDAETWANAVFAEYAAPVRQIGLLVDHDASSQPGAMVAVTGVEDGETYADLISQVTWAVGDLWDALQIGVPPETIDAPKALEPDSSTDDGSDTTSDLEDLPGDGDTLTKDENGNLSWGDGGGGGSGSGLVRGVLTAYNSTAKTCTFQPDDGSAPWTNVAVAAHIGTPALSVPCWAAQEIV